MLADSLSGYDYENNLNCNWIVSANGNIKLGFVFVDVEADYDTVVINSCTTASCQTVTLLGSLSGSVDHEDLAETYTSTTGYLQVLFTTDENTVDRGFKGAWEVQRPQTPEGILGKTGTEMCFPCPPGTYSWNGTACQICPPTTTSLVASQACSKCGKGTQFHQFPGHGECQPCPANTFRNEHAGPGDVCVECVAGAIVCDQTCMLANS